MGKMKEIYMDLQQGYDQELKAAYMLAIKDNRDTVFVHGRQVSLAYAEYLLQFDETFLKQFRNDYINNKDNESK
tara:strand:- start:418 stop:639 length:222 start_codon:yes stop_codon:yes gene_type:complete